jgi:hypothetical protein
MSDDPDSDPFAPPEISTEVFCIHCGETYDSWQIEWRVQTCADGTERGFWCCPIPDCDGMGFGCDILPIDPNYRDERGGRRHDGAEDEDWNEDEWDDHSDSTIDLELEEQLPFGDREDAPPTSPPGDFPFSLN